MFYFPFHIWDVILPIDELIYFKMVIAPPTRFVPLVKWYPMFSPTFCRANATLKKNHCEVVATMAVAAATQGEAPVMARSRHGPSGFSGCFAKKLSSGKPG
jgi:hypothetical protein